MMQILAFLPGALFGILASLYGTVARIYDIMLSLTGYYRDGGIPDNYIITTSNITTTMYTLAGVFMLFRVSVSMINMLIEPDRINDRQAGAGKLLTRIITSLAMLLIFVPTGWVFSKNPDNPGILMRVEKALLAEDGLINNMMPEINGEKGSLEGSNKNSASLIENVNAVPADQFFGEDKKAGYDCYYVNVSNSDERVAQKMDGTTDGPSSKSLTRISGVMHLTFYPDKTTGDAKLYTPNYHFSYTAESASPYTTLNKKGLSWDALKDTWPTTYNCPNHITKSGITGLLGYKSEDAGAEAWHEAGNGGWYGGWHSLDAMKAAVSARNSTTNVTGSDPEQVSAIRKLLGLTGEWLYGVSEEAVDFAQSALASFVQCSEDDSECEEMKSLMLMSHDANQNISNALNEEPPNMTLDFMVGVVAGIGLVVWIALLCTDVIIRRFKLMLLEIMAPIPIIAYADPKDETFNKWGKMYISTYLDLFLKLLAISFAVALLKQVAYVVSGSGLLVFFYISAILIFAKMIPDMISNIFGIKLGSGTFGQIKDMYKKAFNMGVGGIATAGVGLWNGMNRIQAYKDAAKQHQNLKDKMARQQRIIDSKVANPKAKEYARKALERTQREYNAWKPGQNKAIAYGGAVAGVFGGFFRGVGSGSSGKPLGAIDSLTASNAKYVNAIEQKNLSPKQIFVEGIISRFRVGKSTDKVEVKLQGIKDLKEVTKNLQGYAEDFENAIKKIPQLNDLAKLNSQGLITDKDFKNVLTEVGRQMNANRNADGTYNGDAVLNMDHLNIKDINGRDIKLGDFTAGAYAKGVDTAEVKMKAFVDSIKGNTELATVLKNTYNLNLSDPSGIKTVTDIKLSTFDAMRDLDAEEISIVNSKEYQQLKALAELHDKGK